MAVINTVNDMKKILVVCAVLFLQGVAAFSQVVKVENGVSISSMSGGSSLFGKNIYANTHAIGYEYFHHPWFYLSSEVAYVVKGGKSDIDLYEERRPIPIVSGVTERKRYLHLNTTFRARYCVKDVEFYLGLGPSLDVLTGSEAGTFDVYKYKRLSWGILPEAGLSTHLSDKLILGLNVSHIFNLHHSATNPQNYLNTRTTSVSLSLGYVIE
jgi:hypothetical protein